MLFIKIMSVITKKGNNLCYNYTVLLKRNKMNFFVSWINRNEAFIYEIKDFLYLDKKIPIEATRRNKMEETISLKELFQTLKKRMSLIVLITAIAVMVSGIVSYFFITPIYQSSTQLLVNQAKSEQTSL